MRRFKVTMDVWCDNQVGVEHLLLELERVYAYRWLKRISVEEVNNGEDDEVELECLDGKRDVDKDNYPLDSADDGVHKMPW